LFIPSLSKKSSYSYFSVEDSFFLVSSFGEVEECFSTSDRLLIKLKIKSNKNFYLPVVGFDTGFLFGSNSRLIRLSPSFISSHRPTGNLNLFN
jgi:hypothetical protein